MWNDVNGLRAAKRVVTNGDAIVQRHGDELWECLTAIGHPGKKFHMADVVRLYKRETNFAPSTAYSYVYAFFRYCRAAAEDQFSGPASRLCKQGHWYVLTDSPER